MGTVVEDPVALTPHTVGIPRTSPTLQVPTPAAIRDPALQAVHEEQLRRGEEPDDRQLPLTRPGLERQYV